MGSQDTRGLLDADRASHHTGAIHGEADLVRPDHGSRPPDPAECTCGRHKGEL